MIPTTPSIVAQQHGWSIGVVYLFRCERTGIHKVGASFNPMGGRFTMLRSESRKRFGLDLVYQWSIVTNDMRHLEKTWCRRWKEYRAGINKGWEWFNLPENEVKQFCSFSVISFHGGPTISPEVREAFSPLPEDHPFRRPAIPRPKPGRKPAD